jgi:hypothetical protein
MWKLGMVTLVITSAALFVPSLSGVYSAYARYTIYLAIVFGVAATILSFKAAVLKKSTSGYVLATIKFLAFSGVSVISYTLFAVTHSGI